MPYSLDVCVGGAVAPHAEANGPAGRGVEQGRAFACRELKEIDALDDGYRERDEKEKEKRDKEKQGRELSEHGGSSEGRKQRVVYAGL